MTEAVAFRHGSPRLIALAEAFAAGSRKRGVSCTVLPLEALAHGAPEVDVVWLYGLGPARIAFQAYAGRALRIVGDVGYWRELQPPLPRAKRPVRIALNAQQPDAHLRRRRFGAARFEALRLKVEPVRVRGEAILVTAASENDARWNGREYGDWERGIVERLRRVTDRPIVVRTKPKSAPIDIPGTTRCEDGACWQAVRKAWAVVCRSGNVGADALLHGVPVWAESGPGAVYGLRRLEDVDQAQPLPPDERLAALAELAHWQWTGAEIGAGLLMKHLQDEGFL